MSQKEKLANAVERANQDHGIIVTIQDDPSDDDSYKIIIVTKVFDPKLGKGERNNIPVEYFSYKALETLSEDEILQNIISLENEFKKW